MNPIKQLIQNSGSIEDRLDYIFKDKELLALAFVHRSFINENRGVINVHNERLEFLGDSVLGMIVSEYLYLNLPDIPEGDLSYLRSRLVEASSCVKYVQRLDLAKHLLLGKGERMNDGRGRDSILADLFEAIIGAIYLDGGLEASKHFLFKNFAEEIDAILKTPLSNWKALLQDYAQKNYQLTPVYTMVGESGPDHSKMFEVIVSIGGKQVGKGKGSSKKEAQQAAAGNAMESLNE